MHFDADHVAWDLYTQFNDELADACQNWQDSYEQESGSFPYWVQRSWSNTAAVAGHDPCVPAAAGAYHGMTLFPSQESKVTIDQTSGQNGDKANVTVTVSTKRGAGFHVMAITWDPPTSQDYLPHYLPLVIVDE